MKLWSIWDNQVCRALRGAFAYLWPEVTVVPGFEGGTAIWVRGDLAGYWVASGYEIFAFVPASGAVQPQQGVPLCDIIEATSVLLINFLGVSEAVPSARMVVRS